VILPRQKENKDRIKEALSKIDQITFRNIPDPSGDTATFLIFSLPTAEKAKAFNRVLSEEGAGTVYWYDNLWHYYEKWEHLLGGKSLLPSGYPFKRSSGEARCNYANLELPKTAEILARATTIPISINMDEQIPKILKAIEKASKAL
jgi:8-amino-3,8-dideoxy-alpha-D-manno-octulosonate transaminase